MVRRGWFQATGTTAIALRPLSRPPVASPRSFRQDVNRAGTGRGILNSNRRSAIQKVRLESRLVKQPVAGIGDPGRLTVTRSKAASSPSRSCDFPKAGHRAKFLLFSAL